jgi:hypothetical protein
VVLEKIGNSIDCRVENVYTLSESLHDSFRAQFTALEASRFRRQRYSVGDHCSIGVPPGECANRKGRVHHEARLEQASYFALEARAAIRLAGEVAR